MEHLMASLAQLHVKILVSETPGKMFHATPATFLFFLCCVVHRQKFT